MDRILNRRLRWRVPLKLWLIFSFVLLISFYVMSVIATIDAISVYGTEVEKNPLVVIMIERFGLIKGMIIHKIIAIVLVSTALFLIYKYHPPFAALLAANTMLVNFFLVFLNDFFRFRIEDPGRMTFFFQLFEKYPLNVIAFAGLALLLTILITTNKK